MYANRLFLILLLAILISFPIMIATAQGNANSSITFSSQRIMGTPVYVIIADLNDPTVKIDIGLPEKGIAHSESFTSFIKRRTPLAAVTGTYFDTRTLLPTGSIIVRGKMVHESHIGTAVYCLAGNRIKFADARAGEPCDMTGAECGLRTGPRLLENGGYALNPGREGFKHPGLFGARTRMALGVTANNHLLLVSVRKPITFSRLVGVMKALGAVDAVCLDGGTSSAMYYRGEFLRRPGRMLTNVIEVREDPAPDARRLAINIPINRFSLKNISGKPGTSVIDCSDETIPAYDVTIEQSAVLADPVKLRLAKGLHSLFPVNRAQLSGLQCFNYA